MFRELKVEDQIVDYFLKILEAAKFFEMRSKENKTIKGFQSLNVNMFFPPLFLKHMLPDEYVDIKHIHLIEYYKGGYQKEHTHKDTGERLSFILYLNDSDGSTVFELSNESIEISPKKGKLVVFSADILHKALPSNKCKKVAVGAIY